MDDDTENSYKISKNVQTQEAVQVGNYIYYHPAIGSGKFSRVYFGYDSSNNRDISVKKISKKSIAKATAQRIENEVELLRKVKHKNIISFVDVIKGISNIYIICDFANGGDFKSLINSHAPFNENESKHYMFQIKEAMKCLHEHNIIHRDIKPKNLLVNFKKKRNSINYNYLDVEIKLADFGFAKELKNNIMTETLCGTPLYMAPEIICKNNVHQKSDIWSLGIILYEMAFKQYPFGTPENIMELRKEMDFHYPGIPNTKNVYCKHFNELLTKMLHQDPEKRLEWIELFEHKWFNCNCNNINKCNTISIIDREIIDSSTSNNHQHEDSDSDDSNNSNDSDDSNNSDNKEDKERYQSMKNTNEDNINKDLESFATVDIGDLSIRNSVSKPVFISKQASSLHSDCTSGRIVSMVDYIENYCERPLSFSAPVSSAPVSLIFPKSKAIDILSKHIVTSTYRKTEDTMGSNVYSYFAKSLDNLKKYASKS